MSGRGADDRRLQLRSYALLGTFLQRDDLPVLEWVVSQWSLTAKVPPTDGSHQWDIVEAWAKALDLQVQTHAFADFARVSAVGKLDGEGGHVEVGIIADIYNEVG
jgi:hypothetical protein